jgi:branched-chain amino acid transport system substrate-binding protein
MTIWKRAMPCCLVLAAGVSALLVATTSTAGAAPGGAASPARTLTIGVIESMTGSSSVTCAPEIDGMNLAIAEASHLKEKVTGKSGGKTVTRSVPYLRGVGINLNVQDDQSVAAPAVTGYRALVDGNAVAIVGPCSSVGATAIAPQLDRDKIPEVYSTAGTAGLADPEFAFRGGIAHPYFSGRVIQVLKGRGVKSIYAIYTSSNPTLVNTWRSMRATMKALNISVAGEFGVTPQTADYNPAIQQINQTKPDAIAFLNQSGQIISAMTQVRNAGITTQFFGGAGAYTEPVLKGGALVKGMLIATNYAAVFKFPSSIKFTKEFQAKFDRSPSNQNANGYDATWRVLKAIHDAGPAKVAAASTAQARILVQQALAKQTSMLGAQGPLTFDKIGESKGPCGVVEVTDGSGDVKLVPVPTVKSLLKKP